MDSTAGILRIVNRIYETLDGKTQWPSVLADISDSLNGGVAALLYHDLGSQRGALNESVRLSSEGIDVYQRHYHALDPWAKGTAMRGLGKSGVVLNGDQLISFRDLRRTEYYADYARKHELVRILAGVVIARGPVMSVISVLRSEAARPFGREEEHLLGLLMPHLERVLEIRSKLEGLEFMQAASADALDRMPTGVVLVDADGRILLANSAAERLLRLGEGLKVEAGKIRASVRAEDSRLQSLIATAASTTSGRGVHPGGVLAVSRSTRSRPLSVLVSPINLATISVSGRHAAAALFVSDPNELSIPQGGLLRNIFGLTGAESGLVMALCEGQSLADAADTLGITKETARTYVKRAFLKTGTSRQAELIAVASRLALAH
jgi:DNA-binding CsgD family transcriptional regulator/PAS domain-containing protein